VPSIQERWRFESIPNQLVIYSSHKPHSPIKWATDHQWQDQDTPWAHSSCPRPIPISTSTRTRVGPGPNHITSFAVERYFIRPAKCEACVQHDKRDEQRLVLNRHRRKTNRTPEPCLVGSNFSARSPIIHQHMVNSRISRFLWLNSFSNHLSM
jgi:hypothetical protein